MSNNNVEWFSMEKKQVQLLTICRGLPASGKTLWAKQQVLKSNGSTVKTSRDDLRFMLYGAYVIDNSEEKNITKTQLDIVRKLLTAKKNVIVDDTNLSLRAIERFYDLAAEFHGKVQARFQDFPVDIKICIERDAQREMKGLRFVGEKAIRDISKRHLFGGSDLPTLPAKMYQPIQPYALEFQDESLPSAWIFDVDGTIAQTNGRGDYEWDKVDEDEPVWHVIALLKDLRAQGHEILVVSGRNAVCEPETREWLSVYEVPFTSLYMRPQDDSRADYEIKKDIYEKDIKGKYFIAGCVDDRDQVVKLWRSLGLFCAQVNYGHF
jgi:predicted kinase